MAGVSFPAFPNVPPLAAEDITDLGNVTLTGDIRSNQWDGGSNLSSGKDASATAGFFLDSSAGAMQAQNLFAEGGTFNNITILGSVITLNSGTAFPASPSDGELFYRTDQNRVYRYDNANSTWIELDYIPNSDRIAAGAIATAAIADSAITTSKLDALSVSAAKLADAAVDTAKLANLAVEASKLAGSAVTSTKIANAAVGSAAIANAAVGTAAIANAAITKAKIGNAAVDTAQIASAAITNAKINDLSADKITAGTITARQYRTASSGERIDINPAVDASAIDFYDSGSSIRGELSLLSGSSVMALLGVGGWNVGIYVTGINSALFTSAQSRFIDGSASAPGIGWINDADTGLTRPAANQMDWILGTSIKIHTQNNTDGSVYFPDVPGNTTGTAANLVIQLADGRLYTSTSALRDKRRVTTNVGYLADIDLAPTKHYRPDDKKWRYGLIADWLADQDPLLGEYDPDGEIDNYDTRAVLAVLAAKINRLENA